jgi:hypothetical protein
MTVHSGGRFWTALLHRDELVALRKDVPLRVSPDHSALRELSRGERRARSRPFLA